MVCDLLIRVIDQVLVLLYLIVIFLGVQWNYIDYIQHVFNADTYVVFTLGMFD